MPSLYSLNSQTHPFWDFVASLDEGTTRNPNPNNAENQTSTAGTNAEAPRQSNSSGKQPTVEDEVGAESSSQEKRTASEPAAQATGEPQQVPVRGRGRCGGNGPAHRGHHAGRSGPCGGRRGGRGGFGSPGEGFDGFGDCNPFAGRGVPFGGFDLFGPPHHGPPGPHHHRGPPPPPHHHHPERHQRGPRSGPENFNLGEFLTNLGSRIGIDLSGAVEGLHLDRFAGADTPTTESADFEPKADIFDTLTTYLIHLSLPGAKKEDLGVDWDGENSTLRIGGVVHRPGVDEETLKLLAVDGRKREVGVFEKKIHLGTKRDPAKINISAITAKMIDGVLVIKVPKVNVVHKNREVPISGSSSPSPVRQEKQEYHPQQQQQQQQQQQSVATTTPHTTVPLTEKFKSTAAANDMDIDTPSSETEKGDHDIEYDDPAEELPEYKAPGAVDGEEDDIDYVKIDVK